MDFLTSTVLSGVLYDIFKHTAVLTIDNIKSGLKGWAINEVVTPALYNEISKLDLNDELNKRAIEKRITASDDLIALIKTIPRNTNTTNIEQTHFGTGHNVAGSVNIYNK